MTTNADLIQEVRKLDAVPGPWFEADVARARTLVPQLAEALELADAERDDYRRQLLEQLAALRAARTPSAELETAEKAVGEVERYHVARLEQVKADWRIAEARTEMLAASVRIARANVEAIACTCTESDHPCERCMALGILRVAFAARHGSWGASLSTMSTTARPPRRTFMTST